MRVQALVFGQACARRSEVLQALAAGSLHGHAAHEIAQTQAGVRPRPAGGGQDVVGARDVVAERLRRVVAEKDRSCAGDLLTQRLRIARGDNQVLRCVLVADRHRLVQGIDHQRGAVIDCDPGGVGAGQLFKQSPELSLGGAGQGFAVGDQEGLRIRSVLGWESRSMATNSGVALSSAITSTSEGPAGRSWAAPSACSAPWRLASATNRLPGPKILSALGTESVP